MTVCSKIFSSCKMDSYKRIALFTTLPNKTTNAIVLFILSDELKMNKNKNAPVNAGGILRNMISGILNDSNCAPIMQ